MEDAALSVCAPREAERSPGSVYVLCSDDDNDGSPEDDARAPESCSRDLISFDPGWRNLAAWRGNLSNDPADGHRVLTTKNLALYDLGHTRPAFERVCDVLEDEPWLTEGNPSVVVETQAPSNLPARIIAHTIYGFYRGRGIPVTFSGSAAKARAMVEMALDLGLPEPELRGRREMTEKQRYLDNKRRSVELVREFARSPVGQCCADALSVFVNRDNKRQKVDDLADAVLIGYGHLLSERFGPKRKRTRASAAGAISAAEKNGTKPKRTRRAKRQDVKPVSSDE